MKPAQDHIYRLTALLQRKFRARGYRLEQGENVSFVCEKPGKTLFARLEPLADRPDCVSLKLGCRHRIIEEIVEQFCRELPLAQDTLCAGSKEICCGGFPYNPLSSEDELCDFSEKISDFMESCGFAFLESIAQPKTVDLLLNTSPNETCVFAADKRSQIYRGIVAAKWCNNPKFLTLAEIYHSQLFEEEFHPDDACCFDKLMSFLLCFSFN